MLAIDPNRSRFLCIPGSQSFVLPGLDLVRLPETFYMLGFLLYLER
jgi:hypothetical protein